MAPAPSEVENLFLKRRSSKGIKKARVFPLKKLIRLLLEQQVISAMHPIRIKNLPSSSRRSQNVFISQRMRNTSMLNSSHGLKGLFRIVESLKSIFGNGKRPKRHLLMQGGRKATSWGFLLNPFIQRLDFLGNILKGRLGILSFTRFRHGQQNKMIKESRIRKKNEDSAENIWVDGGTSGRLTFSGIFPFLMTWVRYRKRSPFLHTVVVIVQ
jgi:hypothetical protein